MKCTQNAVQVLRLFNSISELYELWITYSLSCDSTDARCWYELRSISLSVKLWYRDLYCVEWDVKLHYTIPYLWYRVETVVHIVKLCHRIVGPFQPNRRYRISTVTHASGALNSGGVRNICDCRPNNGRR